MTAIYPARYKDRFGVEQTSIHNDGKTLTMIVRGVEFEGNDFDSLEPKGKYDPAKMSSFTLASGDLCSYEIEADIPIPVITLTGEAECVLKVELELGNPRPDGGIDRLHLKLHLTIEGRGFSSKGTSGWFEGEMLDLQG